MKPAITSLRAMLAFSASAMAIPTDTSIDLKTRDTPGNVLLCNAPFWQDCEEVHYNLTVGVWPCLPLPARFNEKLGSIGLDAGAICRIWSDPSCSERYLLAITYKPGEADLYMGKGSGFRAQYIGCTVCTGCS